MPALIISTTTVLTWTFWLRYKQVSRGLAMLRVQLQLTEYTKAQNRRELHE